LPRPSRRFLGDRQAEDAELGHARKDLHRHQRVGAMPGLGVRRHALACEATDRGGHRVDLVVAVARVDRINGQERREPLARRGSRCRDEGRDGGFGEEDRRVLRKAEIVWTRRLALAHRDSGAELQQQFRGAELGDQPVAIADGAAPCQRIAPIEQGAQRRDADRDPRRIRERRIGGRRAPLRPTRPPGAMSRATAPRAASR
jgi:hypothetical protein